MGRGVRRILGGAGLLLAVAAFALLALGGVPAWAAEPEHGRVFFSGVTGWWMYAAVLGALILCGLGVPIPEDIILISGGWAASQSEAPVWPGAMPMVLTGLAGIMIGDSIIYWAGRHFGLQLAQRTLLSRVFTNERIEKARGLFQGHGEKIIMAARFMPGARAVVFFSSGAMHVPYWKFFLFDGLAALVSAPLWVILGYVAVGAAIKSAESFKWVAIALMVAGVVAWAAWKIRAARAARAKAAAKAAAERAARAQPPANASVAKVAGAEGE